MAHKNAELFAAVINTERITEPFTIIPVLQTATELLQDLVESRMKRAEIEAAIQILNDLEDGPETVGQIRTRLILELSSITNPLGMAKK